jgi:trehalose/maltose hydrolase-like predicted phosphorylase
MLVSMAAPHLGALETMFIPENWSGSLQVRSGIDGRVANQQVAQYAPLAGRHLRFAGQGRDGPGRLWLRTRTSQSRIEVGVAARTQVIVASAAAGAHRRVTMAALRPEETYTVQSRKVSRYGCRRWPPSTAPEIGLSLNPWPRHGKR